MLVLGFDTATPAVTVAVYAGAAGGSADPHPGTTLAAYSHVDARRHGELLAPAIVRALGEAGVAVRDLDAIAVGVGPGPYTGLRVGVVTAVALSDALGVPAYGVCTLDVLAAQGEGAPVTVVTDARRREVFWASYDAAGVRTAGPAVARPADVAATAPGPFVGAGARGYADVFGPTAGPDHPDAAALCALAAARLRTGEGELLPARPIYLRRPDVAEPGPPKAVTPA